MSATFFMHSPTLQKGNQCGFKNGKRTNLKWLNFLVLVGSVVSLLLAIGSY